MVANQNLDEESEHLVLDAVTRFLERDVAPYAHALERKDEYPHEIVEKQLGLPRHVVRELSTVVREPECVRLDFREILEPQPQVSESGRKGLRALVPEHAQRLAFQAGQIRQLATTGYLEQLLVRAGTPKEERQPGREIDGCYIEDFPRVGVVRFGFDAKQEMRTD